jgi:RNA polymerase sigma factor (sigma-70 family)
MEVSALKQSGRGGLYGRSALLRLQSDERLVAVVRRGNAAAFELLVSRYETRLLSFCRHLLRSREDAEDVLQEVMTAAYNAMLSDDRPINVRPWLYRIARNRCLNHLRKAQAVGVDSMDVHFSDNGASTADKVHDREEFRQLVGDIHGLPETQRTALVLREMDALSYEQIAEAMDTTVPSVKSLLVRARVSLAEASESRLLSCEEVREQLGEVAEGLIKKANPAVRRHVKTCSRCARFEKEIRQSSKALAAALVPISAVTMLRKVLLAHLLGHSASSGAAGAASASATAGATGTGAAAGAAGAAGASAGVAGAGVAGGAAGAAGGSAGLISAGVGAVATKAAAGLAAAALVTAGTVAVSHDSRHHVHQPTGLQVLTTSVNAGVARSAATAPRLAAPVQALPAAKPVPVLRQVARVVTPRRVVITPLASAAAIVRSIRASDGQSSAAAGAVATGGSGVSGDSGVSAGAGPTATAASAATPTASAASVGTPTVTTAPPSSTLLPSGTTPTSTSITATTTTATPSTTVSVTTPTTTAPITITASTTTSASTTATAPITTTTSTEPTTTPSSTTPTSTSTTPSSPPVTGGSGLVPGSPVTTVVMHASPTPSS